MRRLIMMTAVAAAVATVGALSPAAAGAAGHALLAGSGVEARAGQVGSGARLWFRRYNGPGHHWDHASSVAVSRDGTRVFVTGTSQDRKPGVNGFATVAYSAATGRQLWVSRYNVPHGNAFSAGPVAVSRTRVFVTGTSPGRKTGYDYATVAYSAATGRQLWVRLYNGPSNAGLFAYSMAVVNAAGTAVFVTGGDTVAYSAATGRQLWARRGGSNAVAVNHRGTAVFVHAGGTLTAYDAATGRQLWTLRDPPGATTEPGPSVTVNPAGTTVFVTGTSDPQGVAPDYETAAYSASTGTQQWASYYTLPGDSFDRGLSVVVNPAGTAVFVTGIRQFFGLNGLAGDYATLGYDAATGRQLWVRGYAATKYRGDVFLPPALAVSPDGTRVYFTGSNSGYRTLAYNAATGTTLWARHYSPGIGTDSASSIAVSPRGTAVFVTGTSTGRTRFGDYGTIAYRS
jgi:outer membrane protein assembly factor BamB